jgi:hypothetical protein
METRAQAQRYEITTLPHTTAPTSARSKTSRSTKLDASCHNLCHCNECVKLYLHSSIRLLGHTCAPSPELQNYRCGLFLYCRLARLFSSFLCSSSTVTSQPRSQRGATWCDVIFRADQDEGRGGACCQHAAYAFRDHSDTAAEISDAAIC